MYEARLKVTGVLLGYLTFDTVEQWPANLVHILLYLAWRAYAMMSGVAIVAARTGVHGGYELKVAGVADAVFGTTYGDVPILKGLAQYLKSVLVELW